MGQVLIVDDSTYLRLVLKQIISQAGHTVVAEAADGEQAVREYQAHSPDLVMLDITMPVLDGIGALKKIRQLNPQARVIMCTAMGHNSFVKECLRAGACDFIVKPFERERVIQALKRWLE